VPESKLPVGEGERKPSRLATRVRGNLEQLNDDDKKSLGFYNVSNQEEQIQKALDYVSSNEADAMAVLRSEKQPPQELLKNAILVAMLQKANSTQNIELALELASLEATRMGQEISILKKIEEDSFFSEVSKLQNLKIQAYGESQQKAKENRKKRVVDESAKLEKQIEREKKKKENWMKFIDGIEC
jgi:hypothetical protein